MATESQKFQVGLFVLIGAVLVVATLIWLGANRGSKRTKAYVTYFEEADRSNPKSFEAHHYMGLALIKAGKLEEAHDYYSKALKLKHDDPAAREDLAKILAAIEKLKIRY